MSLDGLELDVEDAFLNRGEVGASLSPNYPIEDRQGLCFGKLEYRPEKGAP
jgi:hypothetical protein